MHFVEAKGILSSNNGMNIYRGCTHGCIYCDSRSNCYGFTHEFEDIEVKANAPQLLEKALKSKRKKCMIGTGAGLRIFLPMVGMMGIDWAYGFDTVFGQKGGSHFHFILGQEF